jgi:polar amino acid transport system substrate-binding protein
VHTGRLRTVHSIDDLTGLTLGVQSGDTGERFARGLVDDDKAAGVRGYPDLDAAIADLSSGGCDGVLALGPVLIAAVNAVGAADQALAARLQVAQAELEADGTLQELRRRWLGNPYTDQSAAIL